MTEEAMIVNMTSGVTSFASVASTGWTVTIIVFLAICLTLFLIFRNFRRTVYGSIVTGVLLGIYKFSRWIGISTQENNYVPVKWFAYIVGFIIIAWAVGYVLDKTKILNKFEKVFEDAPEVIKYIKKNPQ